MNFKQIHDERKSFINKYKNCDHKVMEGRTKILISAPHGVSQVRLGKPKFSEIGSLATALELHKRTGSYLVAKTKNNFDDANFDEASNYKKTIKKIIEDKDIRYLIDFHGLCASRDCDINLGTHLGQNIKTDEIAFNGLYKELVQNGFKTTIDQPFMAGARTISGSMASLYKNLWTIQIEINCSITNKKENFRRYQKLLDILEDWIKSI